MAVTVTSPEPLSAEAVYWLVRRHTLRACWATHCLEAGAAAHEVSARLGYVDLRTTARYAAPRAERVDDIADVLDRRDQQRRRAGLTLIRRSGRRFCPVLGEE